MSGECDWSVRILCCRPGPRRTGTTETSTSGGGGRARVPTRAGGCWRRAEGQTDLH